MLTVFDLINEAGTRIPGLMGSSFGLVSALILGTAAVDAGLVSPLLIIVVALSGLGSYALPNYSLSFAFRMGQMALLIAGGLMGLPGVCPSSAADGNARGRHGKPGTPVSCARQSRTVCTTRI